MSECTPQAHRATEFLIFHTLALVALELVNNQSGLIWSGTRIAVLDTVWYSNKKVDLVGLIPRIHIDNDKAGFARLKLIDDDGAIAKLACEAKEFTKIVAIVR